MRSIAQVVYTSDSGTLLPERQWHEEIVIAADRASLARNGRTAETQVNAGAWEFAIDAKQAAALFEELEAVDCAAIRRVEPEDSPDGGDTESYRIVYMSGEECSLIYDPGTTYTGGEAIAGPVQAFIAWLALPTDAESRYGPLPP
jgi:hypothetical protein